MPLLTTAELRDALRVTHAETLLSAVLAQADVAITGAHGPYHPSGTVMTCVYHLPADRYAPAVQRLTLPRPVDAVLSVTPPPPAGWRRSVRELLLRERNAGWYGDITVTATLTDERPDRVLAELDICRARLTGEGNPDTIVARLFAAPAGWGRLPDSIAYNAATAIAYAIGVGIPPDTAAAPPAVQASPHLVIPPFSGTEFVWVYSAQPIGEILLSGWDQTVAFRTAGNYRITRARWDGIASGGIIEVVPA